MPFSQSSNAFNSTLPRLRLLKNPRYSAQRPSTRRLLLACSRQILYVHPHQWPPDLKLTVSYSLTTSKSAPSLLRGLPKSEPRLCSNLSTTRSVLLKTWRRQALRMSRETRSRSKCVAARARARSEFLKRVLLTEYLMLQLGGSRVVPTALRRSRATMPEAAWIGNPVIPNGNWINGLDSILEKPSSNCFAQRLCSMACCWHCCHYLAKPPPFYV